MSKWDGCPIVACKNELCDRECQHLASAKVIQIRDYQPKREPLIDLAPSEMPAVWPEFSTDKDSA